MDLCPSCSESLSLSDAIEYTHGSMHRVERSSWGFHSSNLGKMLLRMEPIDPPQLQVALRWHVGT